MKSAPPMAPHDHPLSRQESLRLLECEQTIERGLKSYVEVGRALSRIRDQKLYRGTHATFREYCLARWRITAARAYQLCDASQVVDALRKSTVVDNLNERQARELKRI